jgi:hypothetical protein
MKATFKAYCKTVSRYCLIIPDKVPFGAPIIGQEWRGTSFRRPECHQIRAHKSLLAIYQTVSLRRRVNKAGERVGD